MIYILQFYILNVIYITNLLNKCIIFNVLFIIACTHVLSVIIVLSYLCTRGRYKEGVLNVKCFFKIDGLEWIFY